MLARRGPVECGAEECVDEFRRGGEGEGVAARGHPASLWRVEAIPVWRGSEVRGAGERAMRPLGCNGVDESASVDALCPGEHDQIDQIADPARRLVIGCAICALRRAELVGDVIDHGIESHAGRGNGGHESGPCLNVWFRGHHGPGDDIDAEVVAMLDSAVGVDGHLVSFDIGLHHAAGRWSGAGDDEPEVIAEVDHDRFAEPRNGCIEVVQLGEEIDVFRRAGIVDTGEDSVAAFEHPLVTGEREHACEETVNDEPP